MSELKYKIRIKSVARYHYRGKLYLRLDPVNRHPNGARIVLEHIVNRELRDHLVGSGYFEDVRSEEPVPVEPVAIPEPVAIEEPVSVKEGAGNDMSNSSITKPMQYGKGTAAEV
jgi:hypothetical protein